MMEYKYAEYAAQKAAELLAIDSPTGYTARAAEWVRAAFTELGFEARMTKKAACSSTWVGPAGRTPCCWRLMWTRLGL